MYLDCWLVVATAAHPKARSANGPSQDIEQTLSVSPASPPLELLRPMDEICCSIHPRLHLRVVMAAVDTGRNSSDVKGHHPTSSTKDSRNTPLLCSSMSTRVRASHHAMAAWNHVMRHPNSICDICFLPIARVNNSTNTASARDTCSIVCRATGLGRNPETDLVFEREPISVVVLYSATSLVPSESVRMRGSA